MKVHLFQQINCQRSFTCKSKINYHGVHDLGPLSLESRPIKIRILIGVVSRLGSP